MSPAKDGGVDQKQDGRQEAERHSAPLHAHVSVAGGEDDGGDDEEQGDEDGVGEVHLWPAGDAHFVPQVGVQEDEEQQGEEEGRAADELEEVEAGAADAAVHHLLQDEGHQGEQHFADFDQKPDFLQSLRWKQEDGGFDVRRRRRAVNVPRGHDGALRCPQVAENVRVQR